jgi:glutamate/tyrosine decarboxylase-like PLP-dependent enzyme
MCQVLGVPFVPIRTDDRGRMDVDDLVWRVRDGEIGTVVGTLGVTGLGSLDPLPDMVAVAREHDLRVHVDAAYGGFFRLIADDGPDGVARAPYAAMAEADSVVIDPHKHGLQPYGCGSVLFRDPSVGRFYKHDSPYTYFTSDELHLGEVTLECSRPGAAAAALWMTLTCLPLAGDRGLGPILRRCRQASLELAELIGSSDRFALVIPPELDIVSYFPRTVPFSASAISDLSGRLFTAAMADPTTPVYLSKLRLPAGFVAAHHPGLRADAEEVVVLRSCLMKPEHADIVPDLMRTLERQLDGLSPRPGG